jgi:hypothetical protein
MNRCYICLENTRIYYKNNNCNCLIYCHKKCFDYIKKINKCIICRKDVNVDVEPIIFKNIERTLIYKLLNLIYDNCIINFLITLKTYSHFILFIIYSLFSSIFLILCIIIVLLYYFYLKYKYEKYNNFNKFFIKN